MGQDSVKEMRTMLLRMSALEADFQVRGARGGGGGGGGGYGLGFMGGANQQDSGDVPARAM